MDLEAVVDNKHTLGAYAPLSFDIEGGFFCCFQRITIVVERGVHID